MKPYLLLLIAIYISTGSLYSQNKTIKGQIITDDFRTVALATIIIDDAVEVGKTDLNGSFRIDIPVSMNKLLFRAVGVEPAKILLADNCDEVEVVMMLSSSYDYKTLKKVDKLWMKRFKKLPELHKKAFEKGTFRTETACYIQEFTPYYNKHRK